MGEAYEKKLDSIYNSELLEYFDFRLKLVSNKVQIKYNLEVKTKLNEEKQDIT